MQLLWLRRTNLSSVTFLILLYTDSYFGGSCRGLSTTSTMSAAGHTVPKRVVVIGGGIQGTSVAYHIAAEQANCHVTLLEAIRPASAASGKGGGFMARSWGDGSPTQKLHHLAFDMYEDLARKLNCVSYRKLPVLSVSPGYSGITEAMKKYADIMPSWLDGKNIGRIRPLGRGDDTAQITPSEFVDKMLEHSKNIDVIIGKCIGIETDQGSVRGNRKVTAVQYTTGTDDNASQHLILPADAVVISAGPWSCAAEDWFARAGIAVKLPMEGIKSTSIVWKQPETLKTVDATALFCGEDDRFGTHLECYPRPDGTIYLCGIGGSDYIKTDQLKTGAFLTNCDANESRVKAAMDSFQDMSSTYKKDGTLEKTQACMRPCPPDALPYMGEIPGCEGAYINAGHNCWGIAWAPACGKVLAELVLTGEGKSIDLRPFDPARFTETTTRRGRKKQGADVGEQW